MSSVREETEVGFRARGDQRPVNHILLDSHSLQPSELMEWKNSLRHYSPEQTPHAPW